MKFTLIEPDDFRTFAETSPYKSFMQTPEIAELRYKNGWTPYYFGVEEDQTLIAAAMLVAKPAFLGKSIFHCPGGPLLDYDKKKLLDFFLAHLKKFIKSHNGYAFHIDPYYEANRYDRNGEPLPGYKPHPKAKQNLLSLGFRELSTTTQPKYLFVMELQGRTPDQILADFKRNTRNHVKKAEKKGVKVRELKREELGILKQITESTSKRRHFDDRPLSYYEQMYDLFHARGEVKFMLAEISAEDAISKHSKDADSDSDNSRGRESATEIPGRDRLTRRENDNRELSALRNDNSADTIPLSAAMFMLYGDEVVYLFSGSDEKYMKEFNAQYAIQWHMIKYAAEHEYKIYNFYGIHGLPDKSDPDYGIYDFKKGFGADYGRIVELLGTFELPVNKPFYYLHQLLSKLKHH